jgi:galactokinase
MSLKAPERAIARFSDRLGQAPHWLASAPGRVNLIGEHTDYSDGFVLPMAIEARTAVAAGPRSDGRLTLYSAAFDESIALDLTGPIAPRARHWSNYAAGVVAGIQAMGVIVPGLDLVVESDVPVGAGLSSSAALQVAVATLVEAASGLTWDPREKARICQRAEHEFAGVPSGIMDQLVAVIARSGRAVKIDCRSLDAEYVDLTDPGVTVMIVNTNVRHDLADGAYADRRAACVEAATRLGVAALRDATLDQCRQHAGALGSQLFARARHVVTENGRVHAAADAARRCDWDRLGLLMYESHASLRDDFAVSCLELDVLVEISQSIGRAGGMLGCRMTGGGFGGSVVCLVHTDAADRVRDTMGRVYGERTGRTAAVLTSRPGDGAYTASIP